MTDEIGSRMPTNLPQSAEAVLRWYLQAGVDEAVLDQPVDRYRRPAVEIGAVAAARHPSAPQAPAPHPASASPDSPARSGPPAATVQIAPPAPVALLPVPLLPVAPGGEAAVADAYALARRASSLEELRAALAGFDGCPLSRTATNLVFGDGDPRARVVLIGEAPGAEEDRRGLPFVGPSGRLLDRMLASIGLDRGRVFISNTLFWRPPGNRTPTSSEIAVCMPFVTRMLELIDPNLLVALGGPAATALLGRAESVGRLRGRWFEFRSDGLSKPIPATAIFHPAYLLRTPAQKRSAWRDLIAIKTRIASS